MKRVTLDKPRRGIPLRALAPNAVTALALCSGLTGVRFAIAEDWAMAVIMIIVAGVLDGLDGRIARLLKADTRFGAELDSLSDVIAFGVSPAIIIYLWSLQYLPQLGWLFAIAHAVCCALRLARFNAAIDAEEQPHKSAGFLTGVPAPAAAGLALLPLFVWLWLDVQIVRETWVVAPWLMLVAFLMISNLATFSWSSLRLRKNVRLEAIALFALVGVALFSATWATLTVVSVLYVAVIPFSIASYAKVRRRRAASAEAAA